MHQRVDALTGLPGTAAKGEYMQRQPLTDSGCKTHQFSRTREGGRGVFSVLLTAALVLAFFGLPAAAQDDPLAQARDYIAAENYTGASNLLRSVTRKEGAPLEAFLMLAVAYERQGLTHRAITAYEDVVRMDPNHLEGGLGLGRNLAQVRSERPRAVSVYKFLLKKYPEEPRLHFGLGMVYNEMAEVTYAFDQYKALKKMDTDLAQQLYDAIFMR